MTERVEIDGLRIARVLHDFVVDEALPGTGVEAAAFWSAFSRIVHDLSPKNRALLEERDALQDKIDAWHRANGAPSDPAVYRKFLTDIGYLLPVGPDFKVTTANVDPEISIVAGPQLVVPVMNARYALNAANARWGSLYDALYGTDAISEMDGAEKGKSYNPKCGEKVIAWGRDFLDKSVPLATGNWAEVKKLSVSARTLKA
jgi:malate synthase